ncbi:MAG: SURF1 family cytochrome oxidase biogenesis protein, partial [Geminicoccaceae bacterium]
MQLVFGNRTLMMRRLLLPLTVTAATLVLLGLGTWQMQRLAWKNALIAEREAAQALPATALSADIDDA